MRFVKDTCFYHFMWMIVTYYYEFKWPFLWSHVYICMCVVCVLGSGTSE